MEKENENKLRLAIELYRSLPFWKRWQVFRWYKKNNWDVKGYWEECSRIADKMVRDFNIFSY